MKAIPEKIQKPYIDFLKEQEIAPQEIPDCLKWLRFYLDFCEKYAHPVSSQTSLPLFKKKLEQKNQAEQQIEQAQKSIAFFYKLILSFKKDQTKSKVPEQRSAQKAGYNQVKEQDISRNQSWKKEFALLNNEIRLRQYSRKTLSPIRDGHKFFKHF